MTSASSSKPHDPVLARLLRHETGLRAGGKGGQHEVLATYHLRSGEKPFATCRDGLLLNPETDARFVPFVEIDDGGYYNIEMVKRAKRAKLDSSEPLSITLRSGEVIDLPVEVRDDGMPDLLTIAGFIQQRATIYRSEERCASHQS